MSVEAGAKAGFIAPDEKAYAYIKDRPRRRRAGCGTTHVRYSDAATRRRRALRSRVSSTPAKLPPDRDLGTSPSSLILTGRVPVESRSPSEHKRRAAERSLQSLGLNSGEKITDISVNRVFIGSCTNSRIEDCARWRSPKARKPNASVYAMIVPGSGLVKEQAEAEARQIFKAAGFDWREPGCSMCLAINPDKLAPGERCASTSNRNFEGRQGFRATDLVSPAMATAAAIAGKLTPCHRH